MSTKTTLTEKLTTPATSVTATEEPKIEAYLDVVYIGFDTKKTVGQTVIKFRCLDGVVRSAVANPAIRWADRLGTTETIAVQTNCKPWRLAKKPTKEEQEAFDKANAPKQPISKIVAKPSKATLDALKF
jgi:hypothetical protein